jgi:hypothetical protein
MGSVRACTGSKALTVPETPVKRFLMLVTMTSGFMRPAEKGDATLSIALRLSH